MDVSFDAVLNNPIQNHDEGCKDACTYICFTFRRKLGPPLRVHFLRAVYLALLLDFVEADEVVAVWCNKSRVIYVALTWCCLIRSFAYSDDLGS